MKYGLLLIALALATALGGGCSSHEGAGPDRVKICLAQGAPAAGFVPVMIAGTDQPLYLRADPVLTGSDIESVKLLKTKDGSPAIGIEFTKSGAKTLARFTAEHGGQFLAIVADGRVRNVSSIRTPITDGNMLISGKMTHEQAVDLAEALSTRPGK